MKEFIKKAGVISLILSIAFLILGIILVNHPENTVKVVTYFLGGVFLAFGIFKLITYFYNRDNNLYYDMNLMLSTLCILLGLVIMVFGKTIVDIIGIIFGMWISLSSVNRINLSFKLKKAGISYWYVSLIIAIILLICGLYIVFSPTILLITLGTMLIVYSIMDIVQSIIYIINTKKLFEE